MTGDYLVLLDSPPDSSLVSSFASETPAPAPILPSSDFHPINIRLLRKNPVPGGRPFIDVDPSTLVYLRFGAGVQGAKPNGGTFDLATNLGGSSPGLPYNASAADIEAAMQSDLTGLDAATVTGANGGPWFVDSNQATNPTLVITADTSALAPDGSAFDAQKVQTANGDLTNRWILTLVRALPVMKSTDWDPFDPMFFDADVLTAGSATVCKQYSLRWNSTAFDGAGYLDFYDGTDHFTVGPIAYNASPQDIQSLFAAIGTSQNHAVAVGQSGAGNYTLTFVGDAVKFSDGPTLTVLSATFVVPKGLTGTVAVDTEGAREVLAADPDGTVTLEIEISESVGQRRTIVSLPAQITAELLTNTPPAETGGDAWATIPDVEALVPHAFADAAARDTDTPRYVGQLGFEIDDFTLYQASDTDPGSWQSKFGIIDLRVGKSGQADGVIRIYGGGGGAQFGTIVPATLSTTRTWTIPNVSGNFVIDTATQTLTNKTLTAPKIVSGGFIADANGNELVIFTTTASAVNEVTFANAATGGKPTYTASGGDSNIGLSWNTKGSGDFAITATSTTLTPRADGTDTLRINIVAGTRVVSMGSFPGDTTAGSMWLGNNAPSTTNYTLLSNNATTLINGTNNVDLRVNNSSVLSGTAAGTSVLGTNTNNNATAGWVGEHASSLVATGSAVTLTTATGANVTSISLTAGDWDVSGNINYNLAAATTTAIIGGISSTSATAPTDGSEVYNSGLGTILTETTGSGIPRKRFSLSGTTTVYLIAKATFSAGAVTAFGAITARRVR